MSETGQLPHFHRLKNYYQTSERGYDLFLWGAKHFGYHPDGVSITEREAQDRFHDLVAERLALRSTDHVLDAGCGQGVVANYLASRFDCSIHGIDALAFQIPKARQRAVSMGVSDRAAFSEMDYSATAFQDESFDCVYTTETLSHSPDIDKTLAEFHRVLKPGGRAALFEYSIAPDDHFSPREMEILVRIMRGSAMTALTEFRHDRFHDRLEHAGFVSVRTDNISANIMPSLARLRRYALLPYYLLVWPFGLQERMPNAAAAVAIMDMARKGLVRYNIYTAKK